MDRSDDPRVKQVVVPRLTQLVDERWGRIGCLAGGINLQAVNEMVAALKDVGPTSLPADAVPIWAGYLPTWAAFFVEVWSETFPPVEPGCLIPRLLVRTCKDGNPWLETERTL